MKKLTAALGLGLLVLGTAPLCADVMVGIPVPQPYHHRHHHRHHAMMSHGTRGDRGNGGGHGPDMGHCGGPGGGPHH
jgi:hypothetical protein